MLITEVINETKIKIIPCYKQIMFKTNIKRRTFLLYALILKHETQREKGILTGITNAYARTCVYRMF